MTISQSNEALEKLESYASSAKTCVDPVLFQSIKDSLQISQFVVDVLNEQPSACLVQIEWHFTHSVDTFRSELCQQLANSLYVASPSALLGGRTCLGDYRSDNGSDYQQEAAVMKLLRSVRRAHSASIACLELSNQLTIEESSARLSILAEVLIQTAYLWCYASQLEIFGSPSSGELASDSNDSGNINSDHSLSIEVADNLLVVAMGKLGGMELNFSSDIDLIFFYPSDGETYGGRRKVANSRFYQKVGIQLIKLLNEPTQDGFVFRVDMRLRPYGDSGNLVMSIAQAEDYYHEQGRGWERFAMVRAKIITGITLERDQLYQIITPFAFRSYFNVFYLKLLIANQM